nr:hypothetical protein [Comamonas koreensis]
MNVKLPNGHYLLDGKDVSAFTNDEERAVGQYDAVPFLLADVLEERRPALAGTEFPGAGCGE